MKSQRKECKPIKTAGKEIILKGCRHDSGLLGFCNEYYLQEPTHVNTFIDLVNNGIQLLEGWQERTWG